MTAANADRCIANTLIYEGGFGRTSADRGDWTSGVIGQGRLAGTAYGIAAMTLTARGLSEDTDLSKMTKAEAIALYRKKEWPECAGDAMPKGLDQIVYDGVVNSGKGRGVPWVGKAVGAPNPNSAREVARVAQTLSHDQRRAAVQKAIAYRVAFLRSLAIFQTFGRGWMTRCTGMEAIGVKMVLEDSGAMPAKIENELKAEAGTAKGKADKSAGTSATAGTAGVAGGSAATQVEAWDWTVILSAVGVSALILAIVGFFAFQAFKNYQRNNAYLAVAKGTLGGN